MLCKQYAGQALVGDMLAATSRQPHRHPPPLLPPQLDITATPFTPPLTCTTKRGPCRSRSPRSRGNNSGSSRSTSATTSVLPNRTASSSVVAKRASCIVVTSSVGDLDRRWDCSQLEACGGVGWWGMRQVMENKGF